MAKDPALGPITKYEADGSQTILNPLAQPEIVEAPPGPPLLPVVILAGGRGTRLQEATKGVIPKPMIEVGDVTLLEHIIDIYANQGFKEFYIATGFMAEVVHRWWLSRREHFQERGLEVLPVTTGVESATGGRLKRLEEKLAGRTFMMTYGDGLSDINIHALIQHHIDMEVSVTLSAAHPPARFGNMVLDGGLAIEFGEKTQVASDWINSGFYVINYDVLVLIPNDQCRFEYDILPVLALQHKLAAYQHPGFFQMIDTPRDLSRVEKMWERGEVPWLTWMKRT